MLRISREFHRTGTDHI